jgi:hypothetical protein
VNRACRQVPRPVDDGVEAADLRTGLRGAGLIAGGFRAAGLRATLFGRDVAVRVGFLADTGFGIDAIAVAALVDAVAALVDAVAALVDAVAALVAARTAFGTVERGFDRRFRGFGGLNALIRAERPDRRLRGTRRSPLLEGHPASGVFRPTQTCPTLSGQCPEPVPVKRP